MHPTKIHFGEPMIGEQDILAVAGALKFRTQTNGPHVAEFEERFAEYAGGGAAIAVSSCMAALHITCLSLIKPGAAVIVPALTHPATAHAVELAGGVPVFVDVDRETGNITPQAIRDAMTDRVTAVMVVHYLGRLADMRGINAVARQHNINIIEDCALALGARRGDTHAGLYGDAGCFSFYPVKHITTGEGGMLLTHDPILAELAREKRSFGLGKTLGLNYRMPEMNAALGLAQMRNVEIFRRRRERNWKSLAEQLKDYECVKSDDTCPAYYAFSVAVPDHCDRDMVRRLMQGRVETSVYYDPIVPLHPYYRPRGESAEKYPNAHHIATRTVCLSCGPHLSQKDINLQVKLFKEATR